MPLASRGSPSAFVTLSLLTFRDTSLCCLPKAQELCVLTCPSLNASIHFIQPALKLLVSERGRVEEKKSPAPRPCELQWSGPVPRRHTVDMIHLPWKPLRITEREVLLSWILCQPESQSLCSCEALFRQLLPCCMAPGNLSWTILLPGSQGCSPYRLPGRSNEDCL